jgi:very-short-patch-repair endonuclease
MGKISKEEAEEYIKMGPIKLGSRAKDITGQGFGRGEAIIPIAKNKFGNVIWLLLCSCGNYYTSACGNLTINHTTSCGCLRLDASRINGGNPLSIKKRAASRRIAKNGNSLAEKHPELVARWDYELNKPKTPHDINYCTSDEYWIKCTKEPHSFPTKINELVRGQGCPYCAGQRVLIGFNDLASQRPDLMKFIHPKHHEFAKTVTVSTDKKIAVVCPICKYGIDGEWLIIINNLTHGQFCPVCAGKKILIGYNDLWTTRPDIAKEIHPQSKYNGYQVTRGSNKKLPWVCSKCGYGINFEWKTAIYVRTSGSGCPRCNASLFEKRAIAYLLLKNIKFKFDSRELGCVNRLTKKKLRHDFIIDTWNLVVELHGIQHYNERNYINLTGKGHKSFIGLLLRDKHKRAFCIENGYRYFEIPYTLEDNVEEILQQIIDNPSKLPVLEIPKITYINKE